MARLIAVSLEGFSEHMNHVLEMILARSERRDLRYLRYPAGGADTELVRLVNGAALDRLPRALAIVYVSDRAQVDRTPFRIERRTLTTHLLDTLDAVVHAAELDQIGNQPVVDADADAAAPAPSNIVDLEAERLQRQHPPEDEPERRFLSAEMATHAPLALVADRNFEMRSRLYRMLSELGFETYCRHSMVDALACAGLHRFQVMVIESDLLRPRAFYYLNELRNAVPEHEPVLLVTSAQSWGIDRLRAALAGSSGFLKTPVEADKLRAALTKLLPAPSPPAVTRPPSDHDGSDHRRSTG
jgi:CheY-like chemotaxis protein